MLSSELGNLNEGDGCVDFSLEALRDPQTKVEAEFLAVDESTCGEIGVDGVDDVVKGDVHWLLVHLREELDPVLQEVVARAVGNGEDPVEEAGELGGTGGELLDLDTILACDSLIGELDEHIVQVEEEVGEVGRDVSELKSKHVAANGVGLINNGVKEVLGLPCLAEAGGVGNVLVDLSAESVASDELEDGVVCVEGGDCSAV